MTVSTSRPPAILSLLADERRWSLLRELARSDRRVGELTELLELPQNLVSYHLGELRKVGLVSGRRSSADGRDVYYRAHLVRCRDLIAVSGAALHPGLDLEPVASRPIRRSRWHPSVLFLCTGNSARSQMAEALLVSRSNGLIAARSAGSHPKPIHPAAVEVMGERGIDIGAVRPKHLARFARFRFDRVVTLCDKVREICPEFPRAAPAVHWSIVDPSLDGSADAFRRVADELDERIGLLVADLLTTPERT